VVAGASAESWGAVRRFVRLCLEILNGYRPTGHVRTLTSPTHATVVIEQLGRARDRVTGRGSRTAARRRAGAPGAAPPVGVRRLWLCEPCGGVAEASVVLSADGRVWALALRLERSRDRWLCTAAHLV
jgi:hypothetical protein